MKKILLCTALTMACTNFANAVKPTPPCEQACEDTAKMDLNGCVSAATPAEAKKCEERVIDSFNDCIWLGSVHLSQPEYK